MRINYSNLKIMMQTDWAISEVLELPIFCKEKKCEAIRT